MGTSIRLATLDGLDRPSRETACGVARPSVATCWYMAQSAGRKRPQSAADTPARALTDPAEAECPPLAGWDPLPDPAGPNPAVPWVKSSPAHCFLNTPPAGPPPAASGNSALARLYQVVCGTIASIRWS